MYYLSMAADEGKEKYVLIEPLEKVNLEQIEERFRDYRDEDIEQGYLYIDRILCTGETDQRFLRFEIRNGCVDWDSCQSVRGPDRIAEYGLTLIASNLATVASLFQGEAEPAWLAKARAIHDEYEPGYQEWIRRKPLFD